MVITLMAIPNINLEPHNWAPKCNLLGRRVASCKGDTTVAEEILRACGHHAKGSGMRDWGQGGLLVSCRSRFMALATLLEGCVHSLIIFCISNQL
jgi:hypothetical protein